LRERNRFCSQKEKRRKNERKEGAVRKQHDRLITLEFREVFLGF